jgi:hypothetical protein
LDWSRPSPSSPRLPVWGPVQSDLLVGPDRTEPYPRPGPSGLVESLAWQDLTMPHGHGVDNCSLRFRRNGRQFELGEGRSPAKIFQRNLPPASHRLWVYVCAFGLGLIEMMGMAMVMAMAMAIVMVLVIVIIVPEVLRQVGWLHQRQHQSFHRLRAFYW